ncbi:MAG: hypothetical protein WBO77_05400 [Microgenomates group bacterium]
MADDETEMLKDPYQELASSVDKIVTRSLYAHTLFDQDWNKPSYHNQFHIAATLETVDAVFDSLQKNDLFEISAQMDQWNQQNPDQHISDPAVLRQAFRAAFACHDLGNITADEPISSNGELVLADVYRSVGAEERGKLICKQFVDETLGEHAQKALIATLAEHIIEQTKFGQEQFANRPFWTLVQTIDQVGSAYFSVRQNEELIAGLIQETNGSLGLTLEQMIEFTNNTLVRHFPDSRIRNAVVDVFEQNVYGHSRRDFEINPQLGNPSRVLGMDDILLLLDVAQSKSQNPQTLI